MLASSRFLFLQVERAVKKSVIALILIAVLVIIVSPGIIGKLAERSVDDNLNWAAAESGELVVTSSSFDRGWFSSEGQHRVELAEGQMRTAFLSAAGPGNANEIPVLLINTRLDHGLIPVSSMSRDEGSFAPGLGSAVSTMQIEYGDGETYDVPGTIYSEVGLSGDLQSRYVVEAGSKIVDDGEVTWQASTVNVSASSDSGEVEFDGDIGALTFGDRQQLVAIDGVTFAGNQRTTPYGFNVGDVEFAMGPMTVNSGDMAVGGNKGIKVVANSDIDDGNLVADMRLEMSGQQIPGVGDLSIIGDLKLNRISAAALGALEQRISDSPDPQNALFSAQSELEDLVAAGFDIGVERLDFALPMGTVKTRLSIVVPETDRANFEWTSLLLAAEASFDVSIPEALVQMASSMDPQMGAVVGMGYLTKNGDVYEMDADLKKGLLTINGAPVPIPLGMFQ